MKLVDKSHHLLKTPNSLKTLGEAARSEAAKYSKEFFDARWRELLDG